MPSPVLIQGLRAADLTGVRLVDPDGVHHHPQVPRQRRQHARAHPDRRVGRRRQGLRAIRAPSSVDVGVFPDRRSPRVLWAGVSGDTDALAALARRVRRRMRQHGIPK